MALKRDQLEDADDSPVGGPVYLYLNVTGSKVGTCWRFLGSGDVEWIKDCCHC